MPKQRRQAELINAASRQLSALMTTIQRLPWADARDVIHEALRRLQDRSREMILGEDLQNMIEQAKLITSEIGDPCRPPSRISFASGMPSSASTPTSSGSSPTPASPPSPPPAA